MDEWLFDDDTGDDDDPLESRKHSRRGDPDTSHSAAKKVNYTKRCQEAYAIYCRHPGSTQREVDKLYSSKGDRWVGKRTHDLWELGKLRRGDTRHCRETGIMAYTWYPIDMNGT